MKENKQKNFWQYSFSNELGRLAQVVGNRVKGTDNIFFVDYKYTPSKCHKDIIYGLVMVDYHQHKNIQNASD